MRRALGILAIAAGIALSRNAAADDVAEAKRFFDAGVALYKEGHFEEALAAFLEANRRSPRASVQQNIAQTERDLHDYVAAAAAYDVLIAKYGDLLSREDRVAAEKARSELEAWIGTIAVRVALPGATISIDGKDAGAAPASIRVNPGPHAVVVRAPEYEDLNRTVDIKGHDTIAIAGPLERATHAPPPPVVIVSTPVVTAPDDDGKGVYVRAELMGVFPTEHHDSISDHEVYGTSVPVDPGGLYGAGVGLRVGYSFGDFGLEGALLGAYDHSSVVATVGAPPRRDDWNFYRGGGVLGIGGRYMPRVEALGPVHPTVGLTLGVAGRAIGYQRLVEDTTIKDKASFGFYLAPSAVLDAGIMIGHTPGVRFFAGIMMMLDLPSTQTLPSGHSKTATAPIPPAARVQAANGPEIFIGPTLGLVFGH